MSERINRNKGKRNPWKLAFWITIGIILVFLAWIFVSIFILSPQSEPEPAKLISNKKAVPFHTTTTKADLNKLVATYLQDFSNEQDIGYDIFVGNKVYFKATGHLFDHPIELRLSFLPTVVDDGNVQLKLEDMSVGALPLPVSYVMRYVSKSFTFPDWVTIIPKKQEIYLDLTRLKLKGNTKVSIDTLDLKKDDISFTLLVPVK